LSMMRSPAGSSWTTGWSANWAQHSSRSPFIVQCSAEGRRDTVVGESQPAQSPRSRVAEGVEDCPGHIWTKVVAVQAEGALAWKCGERDGTPPDLVFG
jgi:hypothetical protein